MCCDAAPPTIIIDFFALHTCCKKKCLRHSHLLLLDGMNRAIEELLAGRTSRTAASVVAGICNTKYMAHAGWFFTTSFMWRGQPMMCQLSHRQVARMYYYAMFVLSLVWSLLLCQVIIEIRLVYYSVLGSQRKFAIGESSHVLFKAHIQNPKP